MNRSTENARFCDWQGRRSRREERRWRIEHAQHLRPDDVPRFGRLQVIASMQGVHCTSDGTWVPDRLGAERSRSGALVINGTDAPVESIDPIACFHASVTRRLSDGTLFFPEQRMSRIEALRSYTINAAQAAFEEDIKGSLEPGKLADIVVLSKDLLTCLYLGGYIHYLWSENQISYPFPVFRLGRARQ